MRAQKPVLFLFCILFSTYTYVHFSGNWNSNSRLDMILAIIEDGSVSIDAYHQNTGDKAWINGHYYSEKPPALALLGVPAFAMGRWILTATPAGSAIRDHGLFLDWLTTTLAVGLITALGGVATFAFLRRFIAVRTAWIVTLLLFLGTVLYPYATMFFSHAAAAGLISIGLWATLKYSPLPSGEGEANQMTSEGEGFNARILITDFVAGLAIGLAVASEFQAFLPAIGVWIIAITLSWKRGARIALAALPPFLLIPWYNWATSGNPLQFPSESHASFPEMSQGFVAMAVPNLRAALSMIISPYRGLFFWSPIFLLACAGFNRKILRSTVLFWTLLLIPLLEILFIASFPFWHGGQSLGPRYVLSVVPLLAIPTAIGFAKHPTIGIVLGSISFLLAWGGTIAFPLPVVAEAAPFLAMLGKLPHALSTFSAHMGSWIGLTGAVGLLPLFAIVAALSAWGYRMLPNNKK